MKKTLLIIALFVSLASLAQDKGWNFKVMANAQNRFYDGNGIGVSKLFKVYKGFKAGIGMDLVGMHIPKDKQTGLLPGTTFYSFHAPVYAELRASFKYPYIYARGGYNFSTNKELLYYVSNNTIIRHDYTELRGTMYDLGIGSKIPITKKARGFVDFSIRLMKQKLWYKDNDKVYIIYPDPRPYAVFFISAGISF